MGSSPNVYEEFENEEMEELAEIMEEIMMEDEGLHGGGYGGGRGAGRGGGGRKRVRIVRHEGHGDCCCGHGGHGHGGHGHGGRGYGFRRQFESREEKAAKLESYLADLKAEVVAVEEKLADLRG